MTADAVDAHDPIDAPERSVARPRGPRPVAEVRSDILQAAYQLFSQRGYERVTLTEIGAVVGLTRGAVLYHYSSKAEVLIALVAPYVARIDDLVERFEGADPAPEPAEVLAAILDAMLAVRPASDLLTRDLSAQDAADVQAWTRTQSDRLATLAAGGAAADDAARLRGLAAIGALGRPLAVLPDPVPQEQREVVLRAACNAVYVGDVAAAAGRGAQSPGRGATGVPAAEPARAVHGVPPGFSGG